MLLEGGSPIWFWKGEEVVASQGPGELPSLISCAAITEALVLCRPGYGGDSLLAGWIDGWIDH